MCAENSTRVDEQQLAGKENDAACTHSSREKTNVAWKIDRRKKAESLFLERDTELASLRVRVRGKDGRRKLTMSSSALYTRLNWEDTQAGKGWDRKEQYTISFRSAGLCSCGRGCEQGPTVNH